MKKFIIDLIWVLINPVLLGLILPTALGIPSNSIFQVVVILIYTFIYCVIDKKYINIFFDKLT